MKILLIKFRNIGDFLISSVLASNLKSHFPQSEISFAINKESSEILEDNPNIDHLILYNRKEIKSYHLFKKIYYESKFAYSIRKKNFDVVINLTEGDRGALYTLISCARYKFGYRARKGLLSKIKIFNGIGSESKILHSVERDLQFLKKLGKDVIKSQLQIFWDEHTENLVYRQYSYLFEKQKMIIVHPVSRWMFKCWDSRSMALVIDFFQQEKGYKVVITGSDSENELKKINEIIMLCKSNPKNLAGKLNLKELSCLTSKAFMFFGIDSAPMHIACATNTPVFALFGASSPVNWGPWLNGKIKFKNDNGIQFNGMHYIVSNMNQEIFYKSGIKSSRGMSEIKHDYVLDKLSQIV